VAAGLDPDHIAELFAAFGPVSVRRMFSGAGLFVDGLMIAIVADGVIYLKASSAGTEAFAREGCAPFRYGTKNGEHVLTSYWRMPERLYDDPDDLAQWARAALAVAQAAQAAKRRPRTVRRPAGQARKR
jgi:DNA transformation protein